MTPHATYLHPSPPTLSVPAMQALLAVTSALAVPFELHDMLAEVAAAARSVLQAERASVWLLDAARRHHDGAVETPAAGLRD